MCAVHNQPALSITRKLKNVSYNIKEAQVLNFLENPAFQNINRINESPPKRQKRKTDA